MNLTLDSLTEADQQPYSMWDFMGWYEWLFIIGAYAFVGFVGMCGNGFVLVLFKKYRMLRKEECVYLMAVLAVADFVQGFGFAMCGGILLYRSMAEGRLIDVPRWQCLFTSSIAALGQYMDQIVMMCISQDRLLACTNAMRYRQKDHKQYAIKSFVFMCIAIPAMFPLAFIGVDLYDTPAMCTFGGSAHRFYALLYSVWIFVMVPTVMVQNVRIILAVRKMAAKASNAGRSKAGQELSKSRNSDVTKTVVLVATMFTLLSGIPNIAFIIATLSGVDRGILGRVTLYVALATNVSAAMNVFIYAAKHRRLRHYMMCFFTDTSPAIIQKLSLSLNSVKAAAHREVKVGSKK